MRSGSTHRRRRRRRPRLVEIAGLGRVDQVGHAQVGDVLDLDVLGLVVPWPRSILRRDGSSLPVAPGFASTSPPGPASLRDGNLRDRPRVHYNGAMANESGHGGQLAVAALRRFGVAELFTLSGGHIFPFYDAALDQGVRIVDVRHESTATFAAEGTAKLTRRPGVAVLTAGPGVTNGVSAVTSAWFNGSPLVVLGGRAPQARWGAGSLQEFDHVPVLAPITKRSATVTAVSDIGPDVVDAVALAASSHRGPVFLDFPLDVVFADGEGEVPEAPTTRATRPIPARSSGPRRCWPRPSGPRSSRAPTCTGRAPGTRLRTLAETMRVPTFANGLGRGCLPADHELAFSRTRAFLKTDADVVMVIGTPLDFRISFGRFGEAAGHPRRRQRRAASGARARRRSRPPATSARSSLAMAEWSGSRRDHDPWIDKLRDAETQRDRRRARRARSRNAADQADPRLRRGAQGARSRRGGGVRRRRLRVLRRQVHRLATSRAAGSTPGPTAVWEPGWGTPWRLGSPGRTSRSC